MYLKIMIMMVFIILIKFVPRSTGTVIRTDKDSVYVVYDYHRKGYAIKAYILNKQPYMTNDRVRIYILSKKAVFITGLVGRRRG